MQQSFSQSELPGILPRRMKNRTLPSSSRMLLFTRASAFKKWADEGFGTPSAPSKQPDQTDEPERSQRSRKPKKQGMQGGDTDAVKDYLRKRRQWKAERKAQSSSELALATVEKTPNHTLEFARLGIQPHTAEALDRNGFHIPTETQRQAIPALLTGQHCALMAETGSGKTLAYALPSFTETAIARADRSKTPGHCCPSVIVVVPTQELATQTGHFVNFAAQVSTPRDRKKNLFVHVLAGKEKKLLKPLEQRRQNAKSKNRRKGAKKSQKLTGQALEYFRKFEAADGVVGTPQRLLTLIKTGFLLPSHVRHIVFDEADLLTTSSFGKTAEELLNAFGGKDLLNGSGCPIQLVFSCATLDLEQWARLKRLAPTKLEKVETAGHLQLPATLESRALPVRDDFQSRFEALLMELDTTNSPQVLIFTNLPEKADQIAQQLEDSGIPASSFHGKRGDKHEQLALFERMEVAALVSTDLGARGIDFPNVFHVIEFDAPEDSVMHLHRAGRTARAAQDTKTEDSIQPRATLLYSEEDRRNREVDRIVSDLAK